MSSNDVEVNGNKSQTNVVITCVPLDSKSGVNMMLGLQAVKRDMCR